MTVGTPRKVIIDTDTASDDAVALIMALRSPRVEIVGVFDYLEHMIENEHDVAAVLIEPIVGTNGVLIPPPEYLPRLREICDRRGVLLMR